jgi:hypothetical protein
VQTPRRLAVLLAALGLVALVGCADDDGDESLAVGDDPPVTEAPEETVPATEAAPPDTVAEWNDIATVEETTVASDEEQIRYAYETWIIFDTPADVRASLLEGGEAQQDEIQAGFEEHEAIIWDATIEVDTVTLLDTDHADVVFRVLWGGRPSPYFPEPLAGTAIREDGTWRVSRETLCVLFAGALGGQCATADGMDTATGIETTTPPPGSQPVVVHVTNQSFDVPDVELVVTIDGELVATGTFPVGDQHTVATYELTVPDGEHVLVAQTTDGAVVSELAFTVDDPEWLIVSAWGDQIVLEHSEERVGFA